MNIGIVGVLLTASTGKFPHQYQLSPAVVKLAGDMVVGIGDGSALEFSKAIYGDMMGDAIGIAGGGVVVGIPHCFYLAHVVIVGGGVRLAGTTVGQEAGAKAAGTDGVGVYDVGDSGAGSTPPIIVGGGDDAVLPGGFPVYIYPTILTLNGPPQTIIVGDLFEFVAGAPTAGMVGLRPLANDDGERFVARRV